jgi:hypothetical protein
MAKKAHAQRGYMSAIEPPPGRPKAASTPSGLSAAARDACLRTSGRHEGPALVALARPANHAQRGAWRPSVHSIQCVNDSAGTRVVWKVFTSADSSA